jgi:hypothetical protein
LGGVDTRSFAGARSFDDLTLFAKRAALPDEHHDGHQQLPAFLAKEWQNVA